MSGVQTLTVAPEEAELRLDRWFKRHFPELGHSHLQKLLRTGQIRLDGRRADAGDRVAAGQSVRVPPLPAQPATQTRRVAPPSPSAADERFLKSLILHRDDDVIIVNKPPGLAVQGGTGTTRHLDGLLDGLRFGAAERPRLVHRLDKDTSGILVLARSAAAAAKLAAAFRGKSAHKIYWAITVGVPKPRQGKIDQSLAKLPGRLGERMAPDEEHGERAVTFYRTLAQAGERFAWLALEPVTGRTHQLRVHTAELGTPILGDGKYGGAAAQPATLPHPRQLHLHARAIALPHPRRGQLVAVAPLPTHMRETFRFLGFAESDEPDPFAEIATAR
jgi:23S rRNA pseudouridine955/2504/2580 synthase